MKTKLLIILTFLMLIFSSFFIYNTFFSCVEKDEGLYVSRVLLNNPDENNREYLINGKWVKICENEHTT